jgi:large exoprotein involved in heme utilization and adhesion
MVTATDTLTLTGVAPNDTFPSGILATTEGRAGGAGMAGNIVVSAPRIMLTGGAQINSGTSGPGAGGSVTVTVSDTLTLAGTSPTGRLSSILATTQGRVGGAGAAGNIVVSAPRVTMDGGTINASTSGTGSAGNIDVQVGQLTLTGGAAISTSTIDAGRGGNVTVRATESIAITGGSVDNQPGLKSLANATGDAGNVFVSAPTLTITDYGRILARTLGDSNAGDIDVRVSRLTLTGGGQIFNGIGDGQGGGNPEGSGRGGNQTVTATDSIFVAGQSREGIASGLFSSAQIGSGRAGNLSISTPTLTMMDGGQISTSTFAGGRGGDLRVAATEAISISGRGSELPQTGLFSVANASGDAGSLFVSAPRLEVAGGRILTRTLGDSNAGDLEVQVGSLTLSEGGQIFSGTGFFSNSGVIGTGGPGRGGSLTVRATDSISIAGSDREGFPSGLFSSAQIGSGRAGNLSVSTPLLTLNDGGLIAADTLSTSSGSAGNIEVRAGKLTLSGGSQISSSTSSSGRGGDVIVAATDRIALSSGGTISASSSGPGDAGDIVIQAGQIFQSRNGAVTTEAEQADGGNIQLTVGSLVELRNSQITATVKSGVGKGGNITIDPQFVVMQGSQVRADAFGGPGGNVRIVAGVFLADPESRVSASSALNIPGTVDIQAPVTSISGAVAPLPQEFARISELLRDRCAGRLREGRVSRLVLGGRDGVPSEPGSLLLSPLIQTDPMDNGEQVRTPARTGQVQERAWHVQAGALAELEAECARWMGHKGATVGNSTYPR